MTMPPANAETFISMDVESAGPNPSQYSLLAMVPAACPRRNRIFKSNSNLSA